MTPRKTTLLLGVIAAFALAAGSGLAGAGTPIKPGSYGGQTAQESVSSGYRSIQFSVREGKITLTAEPTIARDLCLSTPVFTLDGNPTKKLGKNGTFTFTHTFLGNKFDKIQGRFVSPTAIEGFAIYHFPGQELCSAGKSKVSFSAKRR